MVDRFTLAQLQNNPVHFLLDFTWAGRTIRLAEYDLKDVPLGENNANVDYKDGLDFGGSYEDTLKLFQDEPDLRSVDMSLYVSPQLNIKTLIAEGFNLGTATGVLRLWVEGSSDTITLIDGVFKDPSWDIGDSPIVGTLEENPVEDSNLIPDLDATVTTDSWAAIASTEAIYGEYYPIIIGQPRGTDTQQYPTPGLLVDNTGGAEKVLIAGHPVLATTVKVNVPDIWATVHTVNVTNEKDALGRMVATIPVDNVTTGELIAPSLTDEIWISWTGGTGIYSHDTNVGLRGAGDVLRYFLERSSLRWDSGRVETIIPKLNQFNIDTYVLASKDKRITPFHYIQDTLLPILPVSVRYGSRGLYFVYWNYFATAEQAIIHIQQDINADRVGAIETTRLDRVHNEYTLSYDHSARSGNFQSKVTISGNDISIAQDSKIIPNLYAQRSCYSYGVRSPLQESTQVVREQATAVLIAEWKIRRHSQQFYEMSYDVEQEIAGLIEPGSVIKLTDTDRGFTNRVGLVTSVLMGSDRTYQLGLSMPASDLSTAQ